MHLGFLLWTKREKKKCDKLKKRFWYVYAQTAHSSEGASRLKSRTQQLRAAAGGAGHLGRAGPARPVQVLCLGRCAQREAHPAKELPTDFTYDSRPE